MHIKASVKQTALFTLFLILTLFPATVMATMDVSLAWDPNTESNLAGYRLYVREAGEADYNYVEWEGTDTHCTIEGLDRYESYYFVVRAFDYEGNESGDSNEVYLPSGLDGDDRRLDTGGAAGGGGGGCFIGSFF
jgi:hypothetical protein